MFVTRQNHFSLRNFLRKAPIWAVAIFIALFSIWQSCSTNPKKADLASKSRLLVDNPFFLGSETCGSCHGSEYQDWLNSHHDHAMREAVAENVLGDFDNSLFEADGVTYLFYQEEGRYFIQSKEQNGAEIIYPVAYTFGWEPLQQYLVPFPGGRYQVLRASWDTKKNEWFHQRAGEIIDPGDWLHWTKSSMTWNTMCASCHSTNFKKGFHIATDTFHSSFSIIDVSCEACHGPGKNHVEYISSAQFGEGNKIPGSKLIQTPGITNRVQVDLCGPCHARRSSIRTSGIHSGPFLNHFIPQLLDTVFYHADGQIKEEDYVYGSFLQSKMYTRGVKCTDCHNPHSLDLKFSGNDLCGQCHEPAKFDNPDHHFHTVGSEAAKCINCHMTGQVYMGNDFRRDHSFRVPRPDQTAIYNTPNACNNCHSDKTPQWAAGQIKSHTGKSPNIHFSDYLLPGGQLNPSSLELLKTLLKDTSNPDIARATAVNYIAADRTMEARKLLFETLLTEEPLIKLSALKNLQLIRGRESILLALPYVTDSLMAFRMAAANILVGLPYDNVPEALLNPFKSAINELQVSLENNADFREGQFNLGQFYARSNLIDRAIQAYNKAIEYDNLFIEPRISLAVLYNQSGRNSLAFEQLNAVLELDPENPWAYFSIGLLYAEEGDYKNAASSLERSLEIDDQNERALYNLGLIFQQTGEYENAEMQFLTGLEINPDSQELNYALAYLYYQQERISDALVYSGKLLAIDPENADFLQFHEQIMKKLP